MELSSAVRFMRSFARRKNVLRICDEQIKQHHPGCYHGNCDVVRMVDAGDTSSLIKVRSTR